MTADLVESSMKAAPGSATNTRRGPDPQHWLRSVRAVTQPSNERWLPVVGYEGLYEVSDHGRVRSVDRIVTRRDGVRYSVAGRMLSLFPRASGHLQVSLLGPGSVQRTPRVHQLVLEAFVGPCPEGMECCHWDDDKTNNHLSNLRWDTHLSNLHDRVRNGLQRESLRTHCAQGHEYSPENTLVYRPKGRSGDRRVCLTCKRKWSKETSRRKRAARIDQEAKR